MTDKEYIKAIHDAGSALRQAADFAETFYDDLDRSDTSAVAVAAAAYDRAMDDAYTAYDTAVAAATRG